MASAEPARAGPYRVNTATAIGSSAAIMVTYLSSDQPAPARPCQRQASMQGRGNAGISNAGRAAGTGLAALLPIAIPDRAPVYSNGRLLLTLCSRVASA